MAAEILTQSESIAELATLYGEKAVSEAQSRLQFVLKFKSLKPRTVQANGCRQPSPEVEELAQRAGVSIGTLWRWYRLYRLVYESAQGSVHTKAPRVGWVSSYCRGPGMKETT